jgi:hypothetical protein
MVERASSRAHRDRLWTVLRFEHGDLFAWATKTRPTSVPDGCFANQGDWNPH